MQKVPLTSVLSGRDNNFNLIRFGAASAVFISHCPSISGGPGVGLFDTAGHMAVNAFFIISGFLVTKSLIQNTNLAQYLFSRCLRIYPALIIAVFYTVAVGVFFTSKEPITFLFDTKTLEYVFKNILQYTIYVPTHLPIHDWGKVNAPLWALSFELQMYILLAVMGFTYLYLDNKRVRSFIVGLAILITVCSLVVYAIDYAYQLKGFGLGIKKYYFRFIAMFGMGAFIYLMQHKIVLDTRYVIAATLAVILMTPFKDAFFAAGFFMLLILTAMAYTLFYLAYVPKKLVRNFNKIGDYSYGIYIYGYPTQKVVFHIFENIGFIKLFLISFPIALALSAVSWHLLEKHALRMKRLFS